jgi:DNA-binding NarL/FixJ family response regulator
MTKNTVLLVDDHAVFRLGMRELLEPEYFVDEARDAAEAISKATRTHPAVVLMDIGLPGMDGIEAAKQIKVQCPQTNIVILTAHRDERRIIESIQAGVSAYVVKDDDPLVILDAVSTAVEGKAFLPPEVAKRVIEGVAGALSSGSDHSAARSIAVLSSRELEVLRLMAEGNRNRDIAGTLSISERTVGNHVTNIYSKLGIFDRTQAILYAIKKGLVEL